MILCTIHPIIEDKASPNSRDPNKMHSLFFGGGGKSCLVNWFQDMHKRGRVDTWKTTLKKAVLSPLVPHYQNQLGNLWKSLNKKNI